MISCFLNVQHPLSDFSALLLLCLYTYTMLLYRDILHSFLTKVRVGHPLANKLLQEVVSNKKKKKKMINNGVLGIEKKKNFP